MFERWLKLKDYNTLLIGPRRAGKSTYLKSKFPTYKYITLDDLDYLTFAENDPKGLIASLGNNFIIDEIQRAPKLMIAIKYVIDQFNTRIILTGSSTVGLLDQSVETLAGRINIVHLPTCCWGEELGASTHKIFDDLCNDLQVLEAKRLFSDNLLYGGFPEVVNQTSKEQREDVLKRYKDSYFTRDLQQIANIENLQALLAIYQYACQSVCSNLEISSFAAKAGISQATAKKYLNALFQSDLTLNLTGFQFGSAKRHIKSPKVYFSDNGILTAIGSRISQGQFIENFVISEFEKRVKLGFYESSQLQFYRTSNGSEIDLIIEEKELIRAIEIKSSENIRRTDLTNLIKFETTNDKNLKKYLFYTGTKYDEIDGVKIIPIYSIFRGR